MIAYINGSYRCYSTTNGISRHYLGCAHERPREAVRHVAPIYASPLRVSDGASTPVPSAPLPGPGPLDAPSEPLGWLDITDPPRP